MEVDNKNQVSPVSQILNLGFIFIIHMKLNTKSMVAAILQQLAWLVIGKLSTELTAQVNY